MATKTVTWDELVALEPRLATLRAEVESVKDDGITPYFCANHWWYGTFKPRLCSLVGWEAGYPREPRRSTGKPMVKSLAELLNEVDQEAETLHQAVPELLRGPDAYDCAYDTLYHLLPDCRECGE